MHVYVDKARRDRHSRSVHDPVSSGEGVCDVCDRIVFKQNICDPLRSVFRVYDQTSAYQRFHVRYFSCI